MNYLFLIISPEAFYESMIMCKFIDEMPQGAGVFCLTEWLHSIYFSENENIYKLFVHTSPEENKKLIETIIHEGEISAVFVFDFHKKFLLPDNRYSKFVDISWIKDKSIPIFLIDFLDMFDYNKENKLFLKNSSAFNTVPERDFSLSPDYEKLAYDFLKESEKVYGKKMDLLELVPEFSELSRFEKTESETGETNATDKSSENIDKKLEEPSDLVLDSNFYPNIIKLCPPYSDSKNIDKRFIYLDFTPKNFLTKESEKMKIPLGIQEGRKSVLLIFSYQMMMRALNETKKDHYPLVFKTVISHLKQLDIPLNLFVFGLEGKDVNLEGSKIKMRAFSIYNHELYKTIISFSDVIITDTVWSPVLLDAAILKKPAGVIGNSLQINEDGSFEAAFNDTNMEVFKEIEKVMKVSPIIFYPYSSFPIKEKTVPEFTFYDSKLPYYLLDIYSDESVVSFLGEFLTDKDAQVSINLNDVLDEYSKRANNSIKVGELLQKIQNK